MTEATSHTEADIVRARLAQIKREHRLTTAQMAAQCGIPKRSLDRYLWKKNPSPPGLHSLMAIGNGMGVSLDWLCGRTEIRMVRHAP